MRDALNHEQGGARRRRDIVSGCAMPEAELIRFVEDLEGVVTPDLGRKLPGRGFWVAADRNSVELARRKGLFSRSARKAVRAPDTLASDVERLLAERLLSGLGLQRKAGRVVTGFDVIREELSRGTVVALVEAKDGSAEQRRRLLGRASASERPIRIVGLFDCRQISLALGGENVIHAALLSGRGAERWLAEVERLAGFSPLFPEDWGLSNVSG